MDVSQIFLGCEKCGDPLPVDAEAFRTATALGDDMTVAHDVCPGAEPVDIIEPAPLVERRFRCQLTMYEIQADADDEWPRPGDERIEKLAGVGRTVTSRNFAEAVNGEFTNWLNRTWPTMQESAAFADLPTPSPATPA